MNVRWAQGVAAAVLLSSLLGCSSSFDVRRGFLALEVGALASDVPDLRWGTFDGRPAALCYATSSEGRIAGKWIVMRLLPDSQADKTYVEKGAFADFGKRGAPGTVALRYDMPVVAGAAIQGSLTDGQSIVDDWARRPREMLRMLLPGPAQEPEGPLKTRHPLQAGTVSGPEAHMRYVWVSDHQGGTIWLRAARREGMVYITGYASGMWPSRSPIALKLGWIWFRSLAEERGYAPDPAAYLRLVSTLEAAADKNVGFRDPALRDDLGSMREAMVDLNKWAETFGPKKRSGGSP